MSAFSPADAVEMMKGVIGKAKKGNLKAAQMVIDLVKPRQG